MRCWSFTIHSAFGMSPSDRPTKNVVMDRLLGPAAQSGAKSPHSNSESVRESVSACEIKKGFHSVLRKLWESARVVALLLAIQYAHRLISAVVGGDLFGRGNEK